MESIAQLLYYAAQEEEYPYHATEAENHVYRQVERWAEKGGNKKKQFRSDLLDLLDQYQERNFALGLKYGLMLAGELFYRQTL